MGGFSLWQIFLVALLLIVPILYQRSSYFKYQFKMITFYLGMLTIAFFSLFYSLPRPRNRGNTMFVKQCTLTLLRRMCGVEMTLRGEDILNDSKPGIIVINHQSSVDMIPMMRIWPKNCATIAKRELLYAGTFGIAAWLCGTIYIDRMNSKQSRKTLDATVEMIKKEKMKAVIFPEGTRNHGGDMLPFKKGAFHLAVQAQVPVIPVVFSSYNSFYDKTKKRFDEGQILIEVLEPIPTVGLAAEDVTDLTEKTRDMMGVCFNRISQEVKTLQ